MPPTTSQLNLDGTPGTRIQRLLDHAAGEIIHIPTGERGRWVTYFLQALQAQTRPGDFNDLLFDVQSSLSQRMCHGEW